MRLRTNPRRLLKQLYEQRDELFDLPSATPDQSEDVRLTLFRQAGQHDQPIRLYAWKGAGGSVTFSNDRTITLR
jgi:hypothetical protein